MSKRKAILPLFICAACVLWSQAPQEAKAADINARDIRTETRTQWDYQPMQGPRRRTTDRDFFRPRSNVAEQQPLTPPPPVEPGDWRNNAPRAEDMVPVRPDIGEPRTLTAMEVGLQGSQYRYQEKDVGMRVQGPHAGLIIQMTGDIGGQWFLRADGRAAGGAPDYKGSGEIDSNSNYIAEARITVGRDLLWRRFGVAPYAGLGYRHVYNDLRGTTTTGARGYQRYSHYFFAPVGLQPSMRFFNGDRLTLTAEFDPLIRGWQKSSLGDATAGYPTLINEQKTGFGARADLMYKTDGWSFGPFMNYWSIGTSAIDCSRGTGSSATYVCATEPQNHTLEYGFQFRYRFYED